MSPRDWQRTEYVTLAAWLAVAAVLLLVKTVNAEELPTEDTIAVAEAHGLSPMDLQGAVNDTGLDAGTYLRTVGESSPEVAASPAAAVSSAGGSPLVAPGAGTTWPIGGALGQRIYCVEAIESNHGKYMWNPTPWHGEHAQGWLGFLPSTARRWGAVIGNRDSEWAAAAAMIRAGAGSQFAYIAWGRC